MTEEEVSWNIPVMYLAKILSERRKQLFDQIIV